MLNLIAFPDHSRVWIYTADKMIDDKFIPQVHRSIQEFVSKWHSHQQELVASGGILHNRFIVFIVDESKNAPGGCSIDKSVHFVQQLGTQLNIDFFNRNIIYYIQQEEILPTSLIELTSLSQQGKINQETKFFDPLVPNKKEFMQNWLKPLNTSWLNRFV